MTTPKAEPIDWQARCLLAERALKPFAAAFEPHLEAVRDDLHISHFTFRALTIGDLRRASEALSTATATTGEGKDA